MQPLHLYDGLVAVVPIVWWMITSVDFELDPRTSAKIVVIFYEDIVIVFKLVTNEALLKR